MIGNNTPQLFNVDKIVLHSKDIASADLQQGPLVVVDNAGNIVRAF